MDDNGPTRKTYLRNGGNNLEILARLAQMENETGSLKNARSLPKIDRQKKEKDSMQNQLALTRYQFEKQLADLEEKVLRKKLKSKLEKKLRQLESDDYSEVNEVSSVAYGLPELLRLQHLNSDYYNPTEGFVILYDYVTGLDAETTAVKLVARLELVNQENGTTFPGPPSILFAVNFVSDSSRLSSKLAIMAVRQPVAQCEADANMVLVVEVHTAWAGQQLVSQGQCTARLFSNSGNLLSGCWRMTVLPPDSAISQQMLQDSIEVCFRLTSPLIAESEAVLPQPTIPLSIFYQPHQTNSIFEIEDAPGGHLSSIDRLPADEIPIETVGLSIDRLKDAEDAPMKIRMTAYHASTGQILQSSRGPVTCTTPSISITYKNRYHMFGQLQAVFPGVQINNELLLVARVYSTNVGHDSDRSSIKRHGNVAPSGDEGLVAWTSFSLILPNKKGAYSINVGDHVKTLYCPPVPDIPALRNWRKEYGEAYFSASIRIQIFTGSSHLNSPTPSEISDDLNTTSTWILNERTVPPREPFKATDGFDLYIDGCRYLPDAVQITRISAKILDRQYTSVGRHMNVIARIGSDIFNPVFDYRVEFREPNMAATSTLLIKIYTSDEKCEKLITLGYSVLNIFVETGTLRQPITDRGAQVSLNEGSHQLRIHHNFGSDDPGPMSVNCLSRCRLIPGASILVRLVKAPVGPDGWPLEADSLPYSDWQKLGLLKQRPSYDSGVYFSEACRPTQEEKVLMSDLDKRTGISVKEVALTKLAEPGDTKKYQSDNEIEQFIRMKLTQLMDKKPIDIDLKFVSKYNPKHGIKLAIDAAYNIPWSNFTLAHVCLNPPGSLYLVPDEKTGTAFDKPYFFGNLDLNSTCQMPVWEDKYFHFDNRSYHPHLIAIIHLREVEIKSTEDSYRYTLLDEAWTVIEIFTDRYANTSNYQLPLIHGSPKPEWIKQMQTESLTQWLSKNTRTKKIELMPSTSITVRLCDGRRNKELPHSSTDGVILNTEYIPAIESSRSSYEKRPAGGKQLSTMVPRGKTPNEFLNSLSVMFKQLVYKYYLEGDKEGTSVGQ